MASLPDADEPPGASYLAQASPASVSPFLTVAPVSTQTLPVAAPRRFGWRIGLPVGRAPITAAVVMALLITGTTAYQVFKPAPPSPELAVRKYFSALASGDTVRALKLVDRSDAALTGSDPLLTSRALASLADRPTALTVVSTSNSVTGDAVKVTYRLGSTQVSQTIAVFKSQGSDTGYLLRDPFISLRVPAQGSRTVQVNGIDLSGDDQSFTAFPGVYHASIAGNTLLQPETADARSSDFEDVTLGEPSFSVDFPAPTLAPSAQAAVDAQVKQQVDTCAAATTMGGSTNGCPFSGYEVFVSGSVTSIQWTVTAYPQVTLTVASFPSATDQVDLSDPNRDGSVHYVAQYSDYSGVSQTATGDLSFGFSGTAAVSGGQVQVTAH